jgi:hypothetical protein
MTTHLIVIPYGTLPIEFHSYNVTDGMAVRYVMMTTGGPQDITHKTIQVVQII